MSAHTTPAAQGHGLREQITAAICEVIHPQPTPTNDRGHCQEGARAADAVLTVLNTAAQEGPR